MKKYAVTAAVLFGSLAIFGPLTALTILGAADTLRIVIGFEPPESGLIRAILLLTSLVTAYITAVEIARVRLHGVEELQRGTRNRELLRHGILATSALAALVVLVRIIYSGVLFGVENGDPLITVLSVACSIALAWVLVRSWRAFGTGARRHRNSRS